MIKITSTSSHGIPNQKNGKKKTMNETAYSLTMFKKIHKESNINLKKTLI